MSEKRSNRQREEKIAFIKKNPKMTSLQLAIKLRCTRPTITRIANDENLPFNRRYKKGMKPKSTAVKKASRFWNDSIKIY